MAKIRDIKYRHTRQFRLDVLNHPKNHRFKIILKGKLNQFFKNRKEKSTDLNYKKDIFFKIAKLKQKLSWT